MSSCGLTANPTKDNGNKICSTAAESTDGQTEKFIKENIKMTENMDKESCIIPMEPATKVFGPLESSTAKEPS